MEGEFVFIFNQGQFQNEDRVSVSIRNKGLNYGLGCFEGIRAFWNQKQKQLFVFRLIDHYKRFHESGHSLHLNIPYSQMQLVNWTIQLLQINNIREDVYIRPICINGENTLRPELAGPINRVMIYCTLLKDYIAKPALNVSVSSWTRVGSNAIPPQVKSTGGYINSALASTEARLDGYDEAIFLTKEGNVSEGPGENIFIVKNNQLFTPPISDDILQGITRDTVIQIANEFQLPIFEKSIARTELYSADEVFFTGTAIGIKPIIQIDRRIIGIGKEGPITKDIRAKYEKIVIGEDVSYLGYCTPVY